MAYVVFHGWSQIPSLYPMWIPVFFPPGFSYIMTLVPGFARGVLLKSKFPSDAICAESFGVDLAGLNRFNLIWYVFMRRHHRFIEE